MNARRSTPTRRPLLWTAAISVPVAVGAAILIPIAASGAVDLPDKTAKELIEFASASDVEALSGTIEQTSELGLPDLGLLTGAVGGETEAADEEADAADLDDLLALVTGSHTAKVYLDGDNARLQVLDELAERNVYIDGAAGEIWYVDSETQTATNLVLPSEDDLDQLRHDAEEPPAAAEEELPTPDQMLDQALAALDETSEVSVGTDSRVAGRDVYELVITPDTDQTLVGELRFAIDGENGVALSASITARGASEPAFEIGFTQVDFSAPDASVFAFAPGKGIAVTEKALPIPNADDAESAPEEGAAPAAPVVWGEGWSSVVELSTGSEAGTDVFASLDPEQLALLDSVATQVDGGRAVQTSLVSLLITDDGRVLIGAVPTDLLVDAAQSGR